MFGEEDYTHDAVIQYNVAGEPRAWRLNQRSEQGESERRLLRHIASAQTRHIFIYLRNGKGGYYGMVQLSAVYTETGERRANYVGWKSEDVINPVEYQTENYLHRDKDEWPIVAFALVHELNFWLATAHFSSVLIDVSSLEGQLRFLDRSVLYDARLKQSPDYAAYDGADAVRCERRRMILQSSGMSRERAFELEPPVTNQRKYTPARWHSQLLYHALKRATAKATAVVAVMPTYQLDNSAVEAALKSGRFYLRPNYYLAYDALTDTTRYNLTIEYDGVNYVLLLYPGEQASLLIEPGAVIIDLSRHGQASQPWYNPYHLLSLATQLAEKASVWNDAAFLNNRASLRRQYITEQLRTLRPDLGVDALRQDYWDAHRFDGINTEWLWLVRAAQRLYAAPELVATDEEIKQRLHRATQAAQALYYRVRDPTRSMTDYYKQLIDEHDDTLLSIDKRIL